MPLTGGHHEGYALKPHHDSTFKAGKTKRTTGCPDWNDCGTCPFRGCRLGVSAVVFAGWVQEWKEENAKKMSALSG